MTDSGSGAFENVSIIKAVLEETRNDVKLHSVLVERSTVYLKDIAVGGCAEEVIAGMPSDIRAHRMDRYVQRGMAGRV